MRIDRPVAGLARRSRTLLAGEVERTIDAVLAGPLPEHLARSVVEHRVLERFATELQVAYADRGYDGVADAADELLRSQEARALVGTVIEEVLSDAATQRGVAALLRAPEIRQALTAAGGGFLADVAAALRARVTRVDDGWQTAVRRVLRRRPPSVRGSRYGGLLARAIALVVDAVLVQAGFLVGAASVWLVLSLARAHPGESALAVASSAGWAAVLCLYFVGFWSTTGQTPGMRIFDLRVAARGGWGVSPVRGVVRLAGLLLSIALACIPFLPVAIDARRRGLADALAGTVVLRSGSFGWGDAAAATDGDAGRRPADRR